jgi:hypothetical protein
MFGDQVFYYRTIRSLVVAFGSLFSNMTMVKYTNDTRQEVSRLNVPISYEGRENFLTRLLENPNLAKPVEITLPRASFVITGYAYDASRKLSSYNQTTVPGSSSGSASTVGAPAPWNIDFELSIYVRNREDGLQLIEQILPRFQPDYTLTVNYIPALNISRNVPLVLNNINESTQYEGDSAEEERIIIWTLGFTAQASFFGPTQTGNVITSANTDVYINTTLGSDNGAASEVTLNLASSGVSTFQLGETVYQGANLPDSSIRASVVSFSQTTHQLVVTSVNGFFQSAANVVGSVSGASWAVESVSPDVKVVTVTTTPNPANATADDDFGFTTVIEEYGA